MADDDQRKIRVVQHGPNLPGNVGFYTLAAACIGVALGRAFGDHDWGAAAGYVTMAMAWSVMPAMRNRAWSFGYVQGRIDALGSAAETARVGGGIGEFLTLETRLGTGSLVPCGECQHLVPAAQTVNDSHDPGCSLHVDNVADAQ